GLPERPGSGRLGGHRGDLRGQGRIRVRPRGRLAGDGGPQTGDIWYDTSSNNAPKRYTGTVWENVEDPRTASNTAAIQAEQTARADGDAALTTQVNTAISKADRVRTFRQASAPASPQTGDVWYDTANNSVPKRWSGTAWESAEDPRIGQNVAAIQTEATTRANEDEALSQHITKLFARFSGGTNLVQRLNRWTSAFPVTEDATFASRYRVRVSGNAQSTVSPVLTELKPDTDYVLSFKARLAAGASSELHADLNPDTLPETAFAVTSSEWTTFSTVWKSPLAAIKNCRLRFFQYNLAGAQVDVTDVQLEEGNTPSAWSLAPGEMVAMVQQEADARASALGSMSTRIDTVQTLADGNYAAIQEQALSIDGLSAQYTVKVDVNGYVSGFGLATTAKDGVPTSTFTVLAEKFEITAPGGSKISPFVVQNGTVYLRSVVIGTGWIGDTHIGPNGIDAKHLKASSVLTDSIRIGSASGSTLSTVVSQAATGAQDPASRINAGSTTLDPGKIVVKGTRTLTAVGGWFYENTTEINGGALRAGTVTAREVATGTLTVNQFAAFSTGNDLTNSGFEDGWACWDRAGYASGGAVRSFGVNQPNADWHIAGGVTLSIHQPNATTGGYWEGYYRHPASGWSYLPVHPGAPYEFSLYTGAQRCHVQVYLRWLDVNGVEVGVNAPEDAASWNRAEALGGRVLSAYKRLWVKGAAPNNAAFAEPVIRKHDTVAGQADSWAFFALPLFGPCAPYATGPQPWQPGGVTKITGGQLAADDIIIRHNAQLGNATVKTLSIGANQVTVPITSGVMHPGYLPDHDVVLAECYTIEGVGQPIRVTASGMHTLDAYSSQDWGQSTAVFRIQRGTWSPTTGWSWVDLVADLGGSMSMRDISVATGVSKPWSFGVTDREPPAVSLAYRLVGRRIVPWNIVSLAYWSIEATEYRR
ncbi:phage tail tip fiber protein, partial [Azospirillum brasilense]|uniref:phage tail tip fiber protein n=1 Tax=Azospirillum brasilense TaxID=192 RepID=UPI001177A0A0